MPRRQPVIRWKDTGIVEEERLQASHAPNLGYPGWLERPLVHSLLPASHRIRSRMMA